MKPRVWKPFGVVSITPCCKARTTVRRQALQSLRSSGDRAAEKHLQDRAAAARNGSEPPKEAKQNGRSLHGHRPANGKDPHPPANGTNGVHEGTQTLEVPATDNIPFSLHQLHAFKTVVATGSKEQTADLLGVTITNISLMLNKLEKDFDEQLLIRSKGAPMQLTPAGQLLLRYTERMMSLCNDAMTAAKDVQDVKTGTVTVGASQTTGVYVMPHLIGESHAPNKSSTLTLHFPPLPQCLAHLHPCQFGIGKTAAGCCCMCREVQAGVPSGWYQPGGGKHEALLPSCCAW